MGMTSKEKQAAFRQRKKESGESEIRGIYAKTDIHDDIKDKIKKYIKYFKKVRDE